MEYLCIVKLIANGYWLIAQKNGLKFQKTDSVQFKSPLQIAGMGLYAAYRERQRSPCHTFHYRRKVRQDAPARQADV